MFPILINILLGIIAVLLFGLIIFLHELGHFATAKLSGIRVNEFALGMGPTLFRFQRGETTYALRLFPIGGFCAMEGEDEESDDERAFGNKPVWKRFIVVAAGAFMNLVLGLLLMAIIVVQQPTYASTTISKFVDNSALQAAGLEVGDRFVSIDGYSINGERDLTFALGLADPASVAFDTVSSAAAKGADVVIIDTAGRLHNRVDLMNELTKFRNVMRKVVPDAPHEVLLVLDGSTGQNAFQQAKEFSKATDVTALAVTKLDGSAKGGVVIGIVDQFRIPIKFVGVGEGVDDLKIFDKKEFVNSLFSEDDFKKKK